MEIELSKEASDALRQLNEAHERSIAERHRPFVEKYGKSDLTEIVFNNDIPMQSKIYLLHVCHKFSKEEAKELINTAKKEERKRKLKDSKTLIKEKAEKLYGDIPSDDKRKPIPDEVKEKVWRRDNGRCVKCGSQENLEFDHIIAVVKGGSNTARNIQILCERCNREKSANIS